jgi:dihydrolipoamide dehydrogenase
MKKITKVDVAVLGAGTAGLTARRSAEKQGASTALIDPGPHGTTCARVGCMPSKLLIAAADAAHGVRQAETFGIRTEMTVDGALVLKRVQKERDRFVAGVLESIERLRSEGILLEGAARFSSPKLIEVEGHGMVEAKAVVVATGSKALVPPPYEGAGDRLMTNEEIFELDSLPERVLVVGTGIIGLELGQALTRLGVQTTLLGKSNDIGPLTDPKMKTEALRLFSEELDLHADHDLREVRVVEEGVRVRFVDAYGKENLGVFDRVLIAAGTGPNLEQLDLERAGISLNEKGVPSFDPCTLQVEDTNVFLAGDVNGYRPVLHEAAEEGRAAGANAARYPSVMTRVRATALSVVFTDPQIAIVGRPWSEMKCDDDRVGEVDFENQGRSRVMGVNRGKLRLYGERNSGLLEGAEMLGPAVEHMAHLIAWSIQNRMTVSEVLDMPFYHPVVEEGLRTALHDLESSLHIRYPPGEECEEFGPGA